MTKRSRSIKLSKLAQISKVKYDNLDQDSFELEVRHHDTGENIVIGKDGVLVRISRSTMDKMFTAVRKLAAKK